MRNLFKSRPKIKNGLNIKITNLPPCINGQGTKNPYIGMAGEVHDYNGETFSLFTGTSWLVGIKEENCSFELIN